MIFVPNANVVEVAVLQTLYGKQVTNILHYLLPAIPTADDVDALANILDSTILASWSVGRADVLHYNGVRVRSLASPSAPQSEMTSTGASGSVSAHHVPANTALALTLRTGHPGRSYRGRIFNAAPITTDDDPNHAIGSYMVSIQDFWSSLLTVTTGTGLTAHMCVYSRRQNKVWLTEGVATRVLSLGYANNVVDSQRRRLP